MSSTLLAWLMSTWYDVFQCDGCIFESERRRGRGTGRESAQREERDMENENGERKKRN